MTWRHRLQLIVNADRFPEFIQEVGSEAVDIGFAVWSQAGGLFSGNHMPFPNEFVHDFALIMDVHEDQDVGDQMAILDDFSLFSNTSPLPPVYILLPPRPNIASGFTLPTRCCVYLILALSLRRYIPPFVGWPMQ